MQNYTSIDKHIKNFTYISPYYNFFTRKNIVSYTNKNIISYIDKDTYYLDIDSFINHFDKSIPLFSEFMFQKLESSRFNKESELYKDADIDRKRWSDLINNKSDRPHKDLLFKIAFSLKLDIDEVNTLFATKGYCINHNLYRDKLLCYFIMDSNGRNYLNLNPIDRNIKINELLEERKQAPLYKFY
ncbi:MAG: hypothetical protein E7C44_03245 [Paeniclostridium sordellii]|nr:hypothetical protein [Paeniclostridium sordellii]